jgi:glycosyltransferase involved in cell wall biosynthesis
VQPSRVENQPLAILEAFARGVPVIASSVGAIPEQVIDGETGLLVPPNDAEALRAAIERLLRSPDERKSMGAAARERYQQHFSISRCARALEIVYQALAQETASGVQQ